MLKQLSLIKKILVVLLLIALYLSESRLFYLTFLLPLFLLLYPLAYPLLKDRDSDLVKSSSGYKIIMPRVLRLYFVFCFILTLLFFWSILSIGIGYLLVVTVVLFLIFCFVHYLLFFCSLFVLNISKKRTVDLHYKLIKYTVCIVLLVWYYAQFPKRTYGRTDQFQSVFMVKDKRVAEPLIPYLSNVIPEIEGMKALFIGLTVLPNPISYALKPISSYFYVIAKLCKFPFYRNPFVSCYRASSDVPNVGSSLLFQTMQQAGMYRNMNHFFLALPRKVSRSFFVPSSTLVDSFTFPVIVFMHGYLGNWQLYFEILSHDFPSAIILCIETNNMSGIFDKHDLDKIFKWYLPEANKSLTTGLVNKGHSNGHTAVVSINPNNINLVGLSNGGSGMNVALEDYPTKFKSYTFLSTYIEESWKTNKDVYFLYGKGDPAVSDESLEHLQHMKRRGQKVHVIKYGEDADGHMMFVTKNAEVMDELHKIVDDTDTNN